jgi:hypothetical protein
MQVFHDEEEVQMERLTDVGLRRRRRRRRRMGTI